MDITLPMYLPFILMLVIAFGGYGIVILTDRRAVTRPIVEPSRKRTSVTSLAKSER